jgi:hypothetical protein
MTKYDITVKCWSPYERDDDYIGLVLASVIDPDDGKPSNLIIGRSSNNSNTEGYAPAFHFFLTSDCIWPNSSPSTINPKYNISDLSAKFLHARACYTNRFVSITANYKPAKDSNNNWKYVSDAIRNTWLKTPFPCEVNNKDKLY